MSQDVVFRRVRGRIIPIRLTKHGKEEVKDGFKAAGFTAAGSILTFGASAGSGLAYGAMTELAGNITTKNIVKFSPRKQKFAGALFVGAEKLREINRPMKPVFDAGQNGYQGIKAYLKRTTTLKSSSDALKNFAKIGVKAVL